MVSCPVMMARQPLCEDSMTKSISVVRQLEVATIRQFIDMLGGMMESLGARTPLIM
jgi:hypothetical protein